MRGSNLAGVHHLYPYQRQPYGWSHHRCHGARNYWQRLSRPERMRSLHGRLREVSCYPFVRRSPSLACRVQDHLPTGRRRKLDAPANGVSMNAATFDREVMRRKVAEAGLKKTADTIKVMLDWTNEDGWTCISKVRIAAATGATTRTVQNHWKVARQRGFLRSYDYPETLRRTSDHWLTWPGRHVGSGDPGLDALAALYPAHLPWPSVPVQNSGGLPPF